jgi:uncharacterized membrane protein
MDITPGTEIVKPAHKTSNHHGEGFVHMFDGIHFKFPTYKHDHPPVINVNEVADEQLTVGQKVADKVAAGMGSWNFIIGQALLMAIWIMLNLVGWFYHWDVYPFVLLNLAMSAQAAFATPLIMMSQNRQAEKDRLTAQNDYICDVKGEEEIRHIMEHLEHQDQLILQIVKRLEEQHKEMSERLSHLDPEMAKRLGTDIKEVSEDMLEANSDISGNS